ncbi:non-homologous end joining protein Ku [Kitasatospora griseola]|uniref:non-homologous end joining protein Ku n=1 Tax=Kitasatospora griseola TaxID=2064 RepID=UPI0016709E61|nr:Ku protein [Kitasatospora griseola]
MARPVWTGVLSFGLVTVPVALYTATDSHAVQFHQLQRGTGDWVRNKRVNERTGDEVSYQDVVKGFEVADGEYVVVEPDELEQISPGRSRTIDISGFVDLDQVDPIFFDKTYYLGPRGKEYAKIFQLLTEALTRSNRAGIALFSIRGKEYLTAVRADAGLLELHTMHWADELRDPHEEIGDLPSGRAGYSRQELATAEQLIDMLTVDWDPAEYHDTYEEQIKKLIEDKLAGREITASEGPPAEATNVVDLMAVLKRSLEGAKHGKTTPDAADEKPGRRRAAQRPRTTPKKTGGKKSASTAAPPETATAKKHAVKKDLSRLTKAQLYKEASRYEIAHRSTMTRDELQEAVAQAARHLRAS